MKFVITRFGHGSGGKFVSTVLQTHPNIQHWSNWLQAAKSTGIFPELLQIYARRSFPKNHLYHLRAEPMAPYDTSLWSSTYNRGQQLEMSDLLCYYQNKPDQYLSQGIEKKLWINFIFNKINLPKFCNQAFVVTLMIDSTRALDWAQRSLWSKHFVELSNKIIYCPNHPLYCPESSIATVLQYKNQCEFDVSQKSYLMEKYILKNPLLADFTNQEKLITNQPNHYCIPISALFDSSSLVNHMQTIATQLQWQKFDATLILDIHKNWMQAQLPY